MASVPWDDAARRAQDAQTRYLELVAQAGVEKGRRDRAIVECIDAGAKPRALSKEVGLSPSGIYFILGDGDRAA